MRNITPAGRGHNRCGVRFAGLLVLATLFAAIGCRSEQRRPAAAASTESQVKLDVTALEAWFAIIDNLGRGQAVPGKSYQDMFALPAYTLLNQDSRGFSPEVLQRVTEYSIRNARGDAGKDRVPKQMDIVNNCAYLLARAGEARDFANSLADEQYRRRVWELAQLWIEASRLPSSITIHVIVGPTNIDFRAPDHVIIDAGLALASGREQAARMTAASLYANLAEPPGKQPQFIASGREALRRTVMEIQHVAVATWIAGGADPVFDSNHAFLGVPRTETRTVQERAAPVLSYIYRMLDGMLDAERADLLQAQGKAVDDLLRLNRGYQALGYAMAEVITARNGEEAFRATAGDPAAFLNAYQSACGSDTVMPPFPPHLLEQLIALVRET